MNRQNNDADLAPPNASALVESLRGFSYDLGTALADLVDNSLFHKAKNIHIDFHWAGDTSAIAVADDGAGMDEATLVAAMRVGSRSPRETRHENDFGRFGLGLKTASFSQCRRVTVLTRPSKGGRFVRCWDIDQVAQKNEWRLIRDPSPLALELERKLTRSTQGTIVIWEKLDRLTAGTRTNEDLIETDFLRRGDEVGRHFSTVFHRFMGRPSRVRLFLNDRELSPWDPFLSDEPATQRLAEERLSCAGKIVKVAPFVLPHLSKLDPGIHQAAAGLRGWNAHQGFYVYRNDRLLVSGDWLGIKGWRQEEHYKLARIRVDFPNGLDDEWQIDVTKSRARPPVSMLRDLKRIGECTRRLAKQVYTHRGAKLIPTEGRDRVFLWEQIAQHDRVFYRINRDHPLEPV